MKRKLLYFCGSDENERLFKTNIIYSSSFNDYDMYNVEYAVIDADFKICFPEKIDFPSINKSEKYDFFKGMNIIKDSGIDIIISNVYGIYSTTNIRAMLETFNIPIVGSNAEAYYVANNKFFCQSALEKNGVSVPPRCEIDKNNLTDSLLLAEKIGYPLVVKCATLDDSKGVFVVKEKSEIENVILNAFNLCPIVFIEKFIKGKEFRCSVIENENGSKIVPPIIQYLIDEEEARCFDQKYGIKENGEVVKAKSNFLFLDENAFPDLAKKLKEVSLKIFNLLKLKDFMLVDIRVDQNGNPFVLEINLFCSFGEKSFVNIMTRKAGITDKEFLEMTVNRVLNRYSKI